MGTKKSKRKFHERQKLNNEVNPLINEDSSIENPRKGFVLSNDQTSRYDDNEVSFNLEGDANLNDHEIGKLKKKNKRKLDNSDGDLETQKARNQDVVDKDVGNAINERDKLERNAGDQVAECRHDTDSAENNAIEGMPRAKDVKKDEKKRKKQKREKDIGDTEVTYGRIDGKEAGNEKEHVMEKEAKNRGVMGASEIIKGGMSRTEDGMKDEKKRKKKKNRERDGDTGISDGKDAGTERKFSEENILEVVEPSRKKWKQKNEHIVEKKNKKKKTKKKEKRRSEKNSLDQKGFSETEQNSDDEVTDASVKSTPKGASKRVSFSEDVEIFPSSDGPSDEGSVQNKEVVRGKRFSLEEDEIIKTAVLNYIDHRGLGEEGLNMILKCRKHREVRNCWKEIGESLPWRPTESVYHRAHVLFERDDKRKWTEEEYELIRKFHEKYGADWRTLGDALGKHRFHVKDTWRRMNVANRKRGQWSQDEYQSLFDLVNMDLRMRVFAERKSKHGMLRDNISWTAISDKLGTRATAMCCTKWYHSLSSPLVAEGKWLDVDDYHLVIALYEVDAFCMEDIDWDNLLEHRPGDICRKRWNQMVRHLGELQNKSFSEQVEVMMQRYCPDVLEAREAYNSKPIVD